METGTTAADATADSLMAQAATTAVAVCLDTQTCEAQHKGRSTVSRRAKGSAAASQGLAPQVHAEGNERAPAGPGHWTSLL